MAARHAQASRTVPRDGPFSTPRRTGFARRPARLVRFFIPALQAEGEWALGLRGREGCPRLSVVGEAVDFETGGFDEIAQRPLVWQEPVVRVAGFSGFGKISDRQPVHYLARKKKFSALPCADGHIE